MDTVTATDTKVTFIELGAAGTGAIQAGPGQQDRLQEVTDRVGSGEFHQATTGTIPSTCIDGRCGGKGGLQPNAAGGTETLMVADDLTTKSFADDDDSSTNGEYAALIQHLKQNDLPFGGHTAVDCHGAPSGCGANDKLPAIYAYIASNGDVLKQIANDLLGYDIATNDPAHDEIVASASARSNFSNGDELLKTLQDYHGRVDVLEGEHTEVLAVINRRSGTTLDRDAVREVFGDDYEVFNVDEWSFAAAAKAIGDEADVRKKRIAMLYYNLATAGVLCGPAMRVVVLR